MQPQAVGVHLPTLRHTLGTGTLKHEQALPALQERGA